MLMPRAAAAVPARPWLDSPWALLVAVLGLLCIHLGWMHAVPPSRAELSQAHLAWSWNQGRLPYRQVMDLEPPLWAWCLRYPLAWFGQQRELLSGLRVLNQLGYVISLLAVWRLGRTCYGPRVGLAALLLVGLFPPWFGLLEQAGPDAPCCALALAALALWVQASHVAAARWLTAGAGVLAGLALCSSLQMLAWLVLFTLATMAVSLRGLNSRPLPDLKLLLWAVAGFCLAPLGWLGWLVQHGVWPTFSGWLLEAILSGAGWVTGTGLAVSLAVSLLGAVALCWRPVAAAEQAGPARLVLGLMSWLGLSLALLVWPWYAHPTLLPIQAVAIIVVVGEMTRRLAVAGRYMAYGLGGLCLLQLACLGWSLPLHVDALRSERNLLATVLRYSAPGDRVMDAYGASIFRSRAYYPWLSDGLAWPTGLHHLPDNVADALARYQVQMVIREGLAPVSDSFVLRNYLQLRANIFVAGRHLEPAAATQPSTLRIELPGDYVLSDGRQAVNASIDGLPPASRWHLKAGLHQLNAQAAPVRWLVGNRAWDAGWRPQAPLAAP